MAVAVDEDIPRCVPSTLECEAALITSRSGRAAMSLPESRVTRGSTIGGGSLLDAHWVVTATRPAASNIRGA
jgi:hypothetical protein